MFTVSRGWMAVLATALVAVGVAGGCKDDTAANKGGGQGAGGGAAAPDLSTPKAAASAFAKAIQNNDMAAARAASTGPEENYKIVEVTAGVMHASKAYEAAAVAKFGEQGKMKEGAAPPDLAKMVEEGEIKTQGDTATLIDKNNPNEKDPMKLVKKDGQWKVDLGSMKVEFADEMMKAAPALRKAMEETAAEINAGKYKSAAEAQQAMGTKMTAAMMGATTRPG